MADGKDLVARLRGAAAVDWLGPTNEYLDWDLLGEAADEIERLRALARAAQQWRQYVEPGAVPAVQPQAMHFTAKYRLMRLIDELTDASRPAS